MLTSILNYLIEGIASAAVAVCGAVFGSVGTGLSVVEDLIPGLDTLDGVLTLVGAAIVAAGLYLRLFGTAASSLTGQPAEHPVKIAARAMAAGAGVALSSPLCRYALSAADRLFSAILDFGGASPEQSDLVPSQLVSSVFTELIPAAGAGSVLLHFILTVLMAWNVVKIALLTLEHVLILVVSVHLSPLLVGFSVSPSTGDIASGFVRSFVGQCLTLLASAWGFRAFSLSLSQVRALSLNGGTTLLQMAALVLFSGIIASLDGLLARFGFRTLPTSESVRGGVAGFSRTIETAVTRNVVHGIAGSAENAVRPMLRGAGSLALGSFSGSAAGPSFAAGRQIPHPSPGHASDRRKGSPGSSGEPSHDRSAEAVKPAENASGAAARTILNEMTRSAAGKEGTDGKERKRT